MYSPPRLSNNTSISSRTLNFAAVLIFIWLLENHFILFCFSSQAIKKKSLSLSVIIQSVLLQTKTGLPHVTGKNGLVSSNSSFFQLSELRPVQKLISHWWQFLCSLGFANATSLSRVLFFNNCVLGSVLRNTLIKWVSKVIRDCFVFALFRYLIGPENSRLFLPIRSKTETNHDLVIRVFPRLT